MKVYEELYSHETDLTLDPIVDVKDAQQITRETLIPDRAHLLHHFLSNDECRYYIDKAEELGLEDVSNQKKYRNNSRCVVLSPQISEHIWKRLKDFISPIVVEKNDNKQVGMGFKLEGEWLPFGLNPCWRICKYTPGGHFGPHYDGAYWKNTSERSLMTLNIYLNGDFEGGTTNFLSENQTLSLTDNMFRASPENILFKVTPQAGTALIFNHMILHEGDVLQSNVKYIMRSDIMFRREVLEIDEKETKALEYLRQAQVLEQNGECEAAASLYRSAFKLCPGLEEAV
eukprot:TRINITY_DN3547_c0_g1_i1.p1 TRINITY_DN3547_c0_g1~~TRINITY_DN3547_c0_g1_i1.p1  ORF type:complete len:286 (+),score=69.08 TRINITY_DN3547_c0_g1_i1:127-984(+)